MPLISCRGALASISTWDGHIGPEITVMQSHHDRKTAAGEACRYCTVKPDPDCPHFGRHAGETCAEYQARLDVAIAESKRG